MAGSRKATPKGAHATPSKPGAKLADAGRLGIPVIDEGAFLKRLDGR